ncbi:MAG: DUF177 domain-containing protein [Thermovirgaceae bacterium]|jgi:uncharacterized protein|nr:DUF177 domain-containing protein [Synergistales bacterium]MDI9392102.1 DUF177 domain-containing protein [Synergistota bacterium]MDY0178683.1 DUF177 domain-containing protein [Synergistaceae bacterium]HRW87502.1 DUF177 domain-containing protein [Thermovirgaceae bacterium]MDD3134269.1 DUF177 domain-containing protein [Synergistales bacterium]
MKKRGRGSVPGIREKPREWSCAFDSGAVAVSSEPVSISCELPLSGCIEHWGQEYRFNDPVLVSATVTGDTSGMVVELAIEARTEVDCARCLEPTPLEISEVFRYFYKSLPETEGVPGQEKDAESDEDLALVTALEGEIDLSDQVWEYLILSLPEKVLCSEECQGICPVCGKNKNSGECRCPGRETDPRFDVLAELIEDAGGKDPGKGGNRNGRSKK